MDWVLSNLIWVVVSVALGITGNLVWELTRPRLLRIARLVFGLVTLNAKKSRDKLFVMVAFRRHDLYTSHIFNLVAGFVLSIVVVAMLVSVDTIAPKPFVKASMEAAGVGGRGTFDIVVATIAVGALGYFFIALLRTASTLALVRYAQDCFQSAFDILAPVLSDKQLRNLRSSYAQIDSRERCEQLWLEMQNLAREGGIEFPKWFPDVAEDRKA